METRRFWRRAFGSHNFFCWSQTEIQDSCNTAMYIPKNKYVYIYITKTYSSGKKQNLGFTATSSGPTANPFWPRSCTLRSSRCAIVSRHRISKRTQHSTATLHWWFPPQGWWIMLGSSLAISHIFPYVPGIRSTVLINSWGPCHCGSSEVGAPMWCCPIHGDGHVCGPRVSWSENVAPHSMFVGFEYGSSLK